MRILIIRHGESEADILNVHEGRADFCLTEKGKAQARAMAEYVKTQYSIDRIYASPLKRAFQTASYLSKEASVPIAIEDDLMEFNNGLLAGLSFEEADVKYPKIENLPVHESVYGQESKLEFRHRAEIVLSKILTENEDEATIAIVSHGGMINQLYHAFLRLPVQSGMIFATGDTGIHEWLVRGEERIVLGANYTGHI